MTATDELRALLDERGVEYGWSKEQPDQTWWKDQDGHIYFAKGISNPMFFNFTPKQAVEATLGRNPDGEPASRMTDVMMRVERALGVDHGGAEVLSAEVVPLLREALEIIDAAATLGRGECYNDALKSDQFYCSECGIDLDIVKLSADADFVYVPKYCPSCGRRVVDA